MKTIVVPLKIESMDGAASSFLSKKVRCIKIRIEKLNEISLEVMIKCSPLQNYNS